MSYDIYLNDPVTGEVIEFDAPHDLRGGTYAVGGTTEAWLNITYNYSEYYYESFGEKGIRTIYGMTGADSIPIIQEAIFVISAKNKDENGWKDGEGDTDDYWETTAANAIGPLYQLIAMAKLRPDGVWDGD